MKNFTKTIIGIVGTLVFLVGGGFLLTKFIHQNGTKTKVNNNVLAKVNGEKITSEEVLNVQKDIGQQGREISEQQALEQVINQKLIDQRVEEEGYTISADEAETKIEEQLAAQDLTKEELKQQIENKGSTYEDQINILKENMAIQNYIDAQIDEDELDVTEEETKEFYENYSQQAGAEELPPLEKIESQIVASLKQQKQQQAINILIEELRAESKIKYL